MIIFVFLNDGPPCRYKAVGLWNPPLTRSPPTASRRAPKFLFTIVHKNPSKGRGSRVGSQKASVCFRPEQQGFSPPWPRFHKSNSLSTLRPLRVLNGVSCTLNCCKEADFVAESPQADQHNIVCYMVTPATNRTPLFSAEAGEVTSM